jgi:adenylate cyclase class 2
MYEVELKFPMNDAESFVRELVACGARQGPQLDQSDWYFNHPARDFERTDEALRIRTANGRHCITYKGPLVDLETKTRHEIEVLLEGADGREKIAEILQLLGFRPVREVLKRRDTFHLSWHGREFEIAVDDVRNLGRFVEIETSSDEAGRPAATAAILSLVSQFQLPPPERRSYLALLLAKG